MKQIVYGAETWAEALPVEDLKRKFFVEFLRGDQNLIEDTKVVVTTRKRDILYLNVISSKIKTRNLLSKRKTIRKFWPS